MTIPAVLAVVGTIILLAGLSRGDINVRGIVVLKTPTLLKLSVALLGLVLITTSITLHYTGGSGTPAMPAYSARTSIPPVLSSFFGCSYPKGCVGPLSAGTTGVALYNDTQTPIAHVYFGCDAWGFWTGEQIDSPILPGGSSTIKLRFGCPGIYSLRAADAEFQLMDERSGIEIVGTYDWHVQDHP